MSNQPDGGPAFPIPEILQEGGYTLPVNEVGMTLRDYFAGQALVGWISKYGNNQALSTAEYAYQVADAMIMERNKT